MLTQLGLATRKIICLKEQTIVSDYGQGLNTANMFSPTDAKCSVHVCIRGLLCWNHEEGKPETEYRTTSRVSEVVEPRS